MKNSELEISIERDYKIVKANEIIQKARFELNLLEQKTFCYAVSKIKPNDAINQEYTISINDYCDVCGISRNSGKTIHDVKNAFKTLRDKSFYLLNENGDFVLIGWLSKVRISPKCGKITFKFDEDLQKYLIGLENNYTQYSLLCVLPMRSSYSIRLYEILKSYIGLKQHVKVFEIEDLKMRLCAPYERYPDFRRKVLEYATREINLYTDIEASWQPIFKGRRVEKIQFHISKRNTLEAIENQYRATSMLDGQLTTDDLEL